MDNKNLTIFFHCSTHWDREWYLPFQGFRYKLVKTVDDLMQKLENNSDFSVFNFDGQTIVLEDYKEVVGDKAKRLQKLIEEKRVLVGPWYVMPDEMLVSGESLIRNLLFGEKIAKKWNTDTWKYGYVNDVFGHIAQMPQIFSGFNIEGVYLGRGVGNRQNINHFVWKSPDGTKVYTYQGFYGGFSRYVALKYNTEEFTEKLKGYIDEEINKSDVPIILITDTNDHILAENNVSEIKNAIKENYPNANLLHSNLEEMVSLQKNYESDMPIITGELAETMHCRSNPNTGNLVTITNCISSYYPLKYNNDRCQNLLEHIIEPMIALSKIEGNELNHQFVDVAYDYLLKNQPHDSICGCSIDATHKDMFYRYRQIDNICNALKEDFLHVDSMQNDNDYVLRIYNFSGRKSVKNITADLPFLTGYKKDFNRFTQNEPINSFVIKDSDGNEIPYQINSIKHRVSKRTNEQNSAAFDVYNVSFSADVEGFGYNDFAIIESENRIVYKDGLSYSDNYVENEFLRVDIAQNGEISILDKKTGKKYENLNRFVDNGEFGDGWFSMPPANDEIISSFSSPAVIKRLKAGCIGVSFEIIKQMKVPKYFDNSSYTRSQELEVLEIVSTVTLNKNSKYLDVKTRVNNNCKNHKLQLVIPTGIPSSKYYASQAFYKVVRETGINEEGKKYFEQEQLEKNMNGIIAVKDGNSGFAFVSPFGIHEAGVEKNGDIYVTMLRSFNKVFLQPDAFESQIQGELNYHYAFVPTKNDTNYCDLLDIQKDLEDNMLFSFNKRSREELLNKDYLSIDNKNIVLSIVKIAENSSGIIVRLFNASDNNQTVVLKSEFTVDGIWSCKLNENEIEKVSNGREFTDSFNPWQIKTYLLKVK